MVHSPSRCIGFELVLVVCRLQVKLQDFGKVEVDDDGDLVTDVVLGFDEIMFGVSEGLESC